MTYTCGESLQNTATACETLVCCWWEQLLHAQHFRADFKMWWRKHAVFQLVLPVLSTRRLTPTFPMCFTQWHITFPSRSLNIYLGVTLKVIAPLLLTKSLFGAACSDEPCWACHWLFPYRRREGFCMSMTFFFFFQERVVLLGKAALDKNFKKRKKKQFNFWNLLAEWDIPSW